MFRGEFIGLNGGADFYAKDIDSLKGEAEISLKVFFDVCQEKGIQPEKTYSGKFNLRVDPELHHMIALAAKSEDVSINEWVKNRCQIKSELLHLNCVIHRHQLVLAIVNKSMYLISKSFL